MAKRVELAGVEPASKQIPIVSMEISLSQRNKRQSKEQTHKKNNKTKKL